MVSPARLPLTGTPVASSGERSAMLAGWGNAALRGAVSVDRAVRALEGNDEPHRLELPELGGEGALGALRGAADLRSLLTALLALPGAGLRLVLPVPGDPSGLPGPGALTDAALEAGEAVRLAQDGPAGLGLVPFVTRHGSAAEGFTHLVTWRGFAAGSAGAGPRGSERAAGNDFADELRRATRELTRLDIGRLDPPAAAALRALRSEGSLGAPLPRSYPDSALALWAQACWLSAVVDIAAQDDGGAVDRTAVSERRLLLRDLAAAARSAKVAAVNSLLDADG